MRMLIRLLRARAVLFGSVLAATGCGLASAQPAGFSAPRVQAYDGKPAAGKVTLANGIVALVLDKKTSRAVSLHQYGNSLELLGAGGGYPHFDWASLNPTPKEATRALSGTPRFQITVSREDCAEVSFDYPADASRPFEFDLRYVLRRGDSGFYVYAIMRKPADQADIQVDAAGWKMRVNPRVFNYRFMHDQLRGPLVPEETTRAVASDTNAGLMNWTYRLPDGSILAKHAWMNNELVSPVFGATGDRLGIWFVYGSFESFGGIRPTCQTTAVHEGGPILLHLFENSYYGRGGLPMEGQFAKFNGPFFVYVNSGKNPDELWADAKRRAAKEAADWPYRWIDNPLYPLERGTVAGKLTVAHTGPAKGAWVILGDPNSDWQTHKCPYLFWTQTDATGSFLVPHVRPGAYTLYAWVPGVDGQLRQDGVVVAANQATALGELTLNPATHGRLLWQIGIPDRWAGEFKGGDTLLKTGETHRNWDNFLRYHELFPHDVNFVIGQSREKDDWFYFHPAGLPEDFARYRVGGPPVTPEQLKKPIAWNIQFNLDQAPKGRSYLTMGFCSARDTTLRVLVNGTEVGAVHFPYDGASIGIRAGMCGTYREEVIPIDPARLHQGANTITLVHRKAYFLLHVIYDFLRLETEDPGAEKNKANPVPDNVRAGGLGG
jgi:rhamnogalacturonan endolyase